MPANRTSSFSAALTRISGRLICLGIAACLSSCGTTPTAPLPVPKVSAPEQCLAAPDPLPPLADPSLEGLLRHLILVAQSWHDLRIRHACLAEFERLR